MVVFDVGPPIRPVALSQSVPLFVLYKVSSSEYSLVAFGIANCGALTAVIGEQVQRGNVAQPILLGPYKTVEGQFTRIWQIRS